MAVKIPKEHLLGDQWPSQGHCSVNNAAVRAKDMDALKE
jgi:hypothetical protein